VIETTLKKQPVDRMLRRDRTNVGSSPVNAEKRPDISNNSALLIREAIMTAYSLTGNLSSATELCGELADGDLPQDVQAMAVLTKLHNIAMRRPKH